MAWHGVANLRQGEHVFEMQMFRYGFEEEVDFQNLQGSMRGCQEDFKSLIHVGKLASRFTALAEKADSFRNLQSAE